MPDPKMQAQKKPQTLQERLIESSTKTMEKQTKQITQQKLQAGENPTQILDQLMQATNAKVDQLAQTPVDKPGTITGILPALVQFIQGKEFKPFAPQTSPLGIDKAQERVKNETGIVKDLVGLQQSSPEYQDQRLIAEEKIKGRFKRQEMLQTERIKREGEDIQAEKKEAKEYMKEVLRPPKLDATEQKTALFLDTGTRALSKIKKAIAENPEALKNLSAPGNPLGQILRTEVDQLETSILRPDSGATITDDDRKMVKNIVPRAGFAAQFVEPEALLNQLEDLDGRMNKQYELLYPNHAQVDAVKEAKKQGLDDAKIYKYLRQKGLA